MNSARCARPACSGTPAAWLAYDYDARCAWLDDEVEEAGANERSRPAHAWPLCERHADNLKVPRGWFCVDRRASRFGSPAEEMGAGDAADSAGTGAEPPEPAPDQAEGAPVQGGSAAPGATAETKSTGRPPKGARGGGRVSSIL